MEVHAAYAVAVAAHAEADTSAFREKPNARTKRQPPPIANEGAVDELRKRRSRENPLLKA